MTALIVGVCLWLPTIIMFSYSRGVGWEALSFFGATLVLLIPGFADARPENEGGALLRWSVALAPLIGVIGVFVHVHLVSAIGANGRSGPTETTAQTDAKAVLNSFKNEALPVLGRLENPNGIVSLHSNIDDYLPELKDPGRCSVSGLLHGLIAAKHLNRIADYVLLLNAIYLHPQGHSMYMQQQLKRISLDSSSS